jgi:H+/Cl- antiporter ClcA
MRPHGSTSERNIKRPHPLRLAAFMLVGAGFGSLFSPAIQGNGMQLERQLIGEMLWIVCGAVAGGALELLVRVGQRD